MQIIRSVREMQNTAEQLRSAGKTLALVPTMGFLHDGHISLMKEGKTSANILVLSLFVNPIQFGPSEDYSRYPRDFERDRAIAERAGVEILFAPEAAEMFTARFATFVDEQEVSRVLEGSVRPAHFRGVLTVVSKLFSICKPHVAVFGQKDAQQAFLVQKMVRDLNIDVRIIVAPIVRELDGLALSSRNVYLNAEERRRAAVLYESLKLAERSLKNGERRVASIRSEMERLIEGKGKPAIDYIAFIDPDTFGEVDDVKSSSIVVAIAARFGTTRLIDNVVVSGLHSSP